MRRRTLEKLASSLVIPQQNQHEDDDCPMCKGGPVASFYPDAAGNPPTGYGIDFVVKEARKALKAFMPDEGDELHFISMGVSRGGRMVHASFSVDRHGEIHWIYDGMRKVVAQLDSKRGTN